MLGSADKAGSGGDKILKGWESIGWKSPSISGRSQPNKVELLMPLEALMDKRILQELQKRFGDKFENLNKNEQMVLALALTENKVNNERLRHMLPLHPADITHILQQLSKPGMLIPDGHGRGTTYQLKEESERRTLQAKQETLQAGEENANPMPKRMSREELAEKIVDFCSEWRTAEEIAGFIQRNKRYLSNEVLPKMGNLLELKYPQVKRHPDQKYRSRTIRGKQPEA